jgi:hypothetical protein
MLRKKRAIEAITEKSEGWLHIEQITNTLSIQCDVFTSDSHGRNTTVSKHHAHIHRNASETNLAIHEHRKLHTLIHATQRTHLIENTVKTAIQPILRHLIVWGALNETKEIHAGKNKQV